MIKQDGYHQQQANQSDHGVYESGNSTLHDVDVLGTGVEHC